MGCANLLMIEIPDGIRIIPARTFKNCIALSQVEISNNSALSVIGESAFESCEELKGLVLPTTIKRIEKRTFYRTKNLKTFSFPQELKFIGKEAFYFFGIGRETEYS